MAPFQRASLSTFCLFGIILSASLQSTNAAFLRNTNDDNDNHHFSLLQSVRSTMHRVSNLVFGHHQEDTTTTRQMQSSGNDEGPFFYGEDVIGTALMLKNFINTKLYLVAVFKYRKEAVYEDGRATNLTGFEADKIYTNVILSEILPEIGGELRFLSLIDVTTNPANITINTQAQDQPWDAVAVLEYPNSAGFVQMAANPKFKELGIHKKAGLVDTLVFACEAMPGTSMGSLSDMPGVDVFRNFNNQTHIPMATVTVLDYNRFAQYQDGDADASRYRSGSNAVQTYEDAVSSTKLAHGMRTAMRFRIRNTLIAGGAGWDEVRIDTFPSHNDYDAMQNDPALDDQKYHYTAGVHRSSSFQVRPLFINSLGGNGQEGYYDACATEPPLVDANTEGLGVADLYDMSCPVNEGL